MKRDSLKLNKVSVVAFVLVMTAISLGGLIAFFIIDQHTENEEPKYIKTEMTILPQGWRVLSQEELDLANEGAREVWQDEPKGVNIIDFNVPRAGNSLTGSPYWGTMVSSVFHSPV